MDIGEYRQNGVLTFGLGGNEAKGRPKQFTSREMADFMNRLARKVGIHRNPNNPTGHFAAPEDFPNAAD